MAWMVGQIRLMSRDCAEEELSRQCDLRTDLRKRKFAGRAYVGRKAEWPRWTPTTAMIQRDPVKNGPWAAGMPAGLDNPLGPRALYLYQNGRDTLYRIHGTHEPHTIGTAVSSGCIRMLNQDIIDLYRRAPTSTVVVVLPDTHWRDASPLS